MAGSSFAIYDVTTGDIKRVIMGSETVAAMNLKDGEALLDVGVERVNAQRRYVADPGGTPVLADKPI